ncbi:glycerate kinase [Chloroflexota bacterium]
MIIKNRQLIATTDLRKQALDILTTGISRVLPQNVMESAVKYDAANRVISVGGDKYHLAGGRVFVIGGGKAAAAMAATLEAILGPGVIHAGVVNDKGSQHRTEKIKVVTAGHPIPDQRGVSGVREMLALKQHYDIGENDLVICLISGGGSALLPSPTDGINLRGKQLTTELLINSGADIGAINVVRKHLSRVKGGRMGQFYAPATVISLIISDVTGNDLAAIASGPTSPDPSTFVGAASILQQYDLRDKTPENVVKLLERGAEGELAETPKVLTNCRNYIIGDNGLALEAMRERAIKLGRTPLVITSQQEGDTNDVALSRADEILSRKYAGYDTILLGGETTLLVPATAGRGGRNQHYAAVSLLALKKYPGRWVAASVGSDGSDFLPDVAGAIVDRGSLDSARAKGIDVSNYLARFDSNTLLEQIGNALVVTGNTGTNVGDIILYLLQPGVSEQDEGNAA